MVVTFVVGGIKNKKFKQIKYTNIMPMLIAISIILSVCGLISWAWVRGIDYMQKNHPDYKGEDLFGEEENKENIK